MFDDMIANIMTNKKILAIIKELFIRYRKLNISLVFITQSYFSAPKGITVTEPDNNAYDKKLAFKNNAPFTSCILKLIIHSLIMHNT